MVHQKSLATLIVVATVVLATVAVTPVAAHDSQEIDGYELTFGGADEPVITDERMWLKLSITDENGDPVPDQADSLEWTLEKPGDVDPVDLEVSESHGEPGVYETPVVFTEPGKYVVHMKGTIEDTEIHTHFEKEVESSGDLQYPENDSVDTLEERVDELEGELEHQHEALHELQEQVESDDTQEQVEDQASEGEPGTESAALSGSWVAGGIGIIALGAIGVLLTRKRN